MKNLLRLLVLLIVTKSAYSQDARIYYSDYSETIHSTSLSGDDDKVILTSFNTPVYISFYNNKLYVSDNNLVNRNFRFAPDGSLGEVIHDEIDGVIKPSSVSGYNNELYFIDRDYIRKSDMDGNNIVDLIDVGSTVQSKVQVVNNKIYWNAHSALWSANLDGTNELDITDNGNSFYGFWVEGDIVYYITSSPGLGYTIKKTPIDGSSETTLLSSSSSLNLSSPSDLTVFENKIYYTDTGLDKIMRMNLDGSNVEEVYDIAGSVPNPIGIAGYNGYIYWADKSSSKQTVNRISTNLTNFEVVLGDGIDNIKDFDLYKDELVFSDNYIKKSNIDGSVVSTLSANNSNTVDVKVSKFDEVYFSFSTSIMKTPINSYNPQTVVNFQTTSNYIDSFDISSDYIYWIENENEQGKVFRAFIDGTNIENIFTDTATLYGITIYNDKLYWTRGYERDVLIEANLDGTNTQTVISISGTINNFELYCGRVYFGLTFPGFTGYSLNSVELDGTNLQLIKELPSQITEMNIYDPLAIQLSCQNTTVEANGSNEYHLPDYTTTISLDNVNCSDEISIVQFPLAGTEIIENTDVLVTVLDNEGFQIIECSFEASLATLSLNDLNGGDKDLVLFPNPAKDNITIKGNSTFNHITIYDLYGKRVTTISLEIGLEQYSLNTENLTSGIYYLEVKSGNSKQILKFLKN